MDEDRPTDLLSEAESYSPNSSSADTTDSDTETQNSDPPVKRANILAITHINAQSLRHKIDDLEIESVGCDLLAITETWLK